MLFITTCLSKHHPTEKRALLFEPKLAVCITKRQWHPSQEFHMRRDGCIEMRFESTGRKHPVDTLVDARRKGAGPKSLPDRICKKLESGLRSP